MVDDDDGDGFPSQEPRMDSRSALPRGFRAWRRLRIIKCDESFSLIFFLPENEYMELELRSVEVQGTHKAGGRALGGHPCGQLVGPLELILSLVFLYIPQKFSVNFQVSLRTLISAQKLHHGNYAENIIGPG